MKLDNFNNEFDLVAIINSIKLKKEEIKQFIKLKKIHNFV